jgi:hypothetical protein
MAKRKWTNNDLQNITEKNKGRATRTPLKPMVISGALEELAFPAKHVAPGVFLLLQTR